jgi:lipopolysaccharide transport system permease protein
MSTEFTKNIPLSSLTERVISPHDGLDAFRYNLISLVKEWPFTRHLAYRIFIRDTQAMFRMSFLGYFWLIAPALANTLVWVLLSNSEVVKIDSGNVPYPLFVFVGTWLWTAFNSCLVSSLGLVDEAKSTLVKVNFPIESILLAGFGKNLLTVLITGIGLIPFLILYPVTPKLTMILFPFELIMVMLFGVAIGLFFVPIAALFSDISRTIHLALRFAFFLTPVIYPIPAQGLTRTLILSNPVSAMIVTPRWSLLGGEEPAVILFISFSLLAIILLFMSLLAVKVALPHILERLSGT